MRILFKHGLEKPAKSAVLVSKKIVRHAVDRNYCKRVARELFRTRQHQAEHLELVIQVRKKFVRAQFEKVSQEFDFLLLKITRRPAF